MDALEAAAEATGAPILILIDALNESPDRNRWRAWTADMIAGPGQARATVKFCLTCRDIYMEEVFGDLRSKLLSYPHNGFSGHEYDAATSFASYYGLDRPGNLIAQPEFSNPLFLHLACRAAVAQSQRAVPSGAIDIVKLVEAIVNYINQRIAQTVGFDSRARNLASEAIILLSRKMAELGSRHLSLPTAHSLLDDLFRSVGFENSLFRQLEIEYLITVLELPDGYFVRFTFERLGDLLIAQALIADLEPQDLMNSISRSGIPGLASDASKIASNAGLLRALAVVLPDKFGIELFEAFPVSDESVELTLIALESLAWRRASSVPSSNWFSRRLSRLSDIVTGLDKVMAVATVPEHPFNAHFVHRYLSGYTLVDRDVIFGLTMLGSWESGGFVKRLIKLARTQDISALPPPEATLLGIILCWFCSSSDRRIRDEATKALSVVLVAHPQSVYVLFNIFIDTKDDYILERLFGATYASCLASSDFATIESLSKIVHNVFVEGYWQSEHAVIRDTARLLIESATNRGVTLSGQWPPNYQSGTAMSWPPSVDSESWQALREKYESFPNNIFLGASIGSDFARYVVDSGVLRNFDLPASRITRDQALHWIFDQILAYGYPGFGENALAFDWDIIRRHGQGRASPRYAERLSKKYAWIATARLTGILYDNAVQKPRGTATALQGLSLRTIDPTNVTETKVREAFDPLALWIGTSNDHFSDKMWIKANDFLMLIPEQSPWVAIFSSREVRDPAEGNQSDADDGPYRLSSDNAEARLIRSADMAKFLSAVKEGPPDTGIRTISNVYVGEYPTGRPFTEIESECTEPRIIGALHTWDATLSINRRFEYDCSDGDTSELIVPNPDIIRFGSLRWDRDKGWTAPDGSSQVVQVENGGQKALLVRHDLLTSYLTSRKLKMFWLAHQSKTIVRPSSPDARYRERLLVYAHTRGKLKVVGQFEERTDNEDAAT